MCNSFTCKIPIIGSSYLCVINSQWFGSEIKFLFVHNNQAWSGKFQLTENHFVAELLDRLSLTREAYVEESRKALTTHSGADDFTYSLENDMFSWKKNIRKMSVKFGSVDLLKVQLVDAFEEILESTIQSRINLTKNLKKIEIQKDSLEKDNNILKSKLNAAVEKKNEIEVTLYCQFLHLLNEKKRRIKELQEKISDSDYQDVIQNDESDHFDSDTEVDSEEENCCESKSPLERNCYVKNEPATISKRATQKRPNGSIAGPSGESSKVKNSKVLPIKKKTGNKGKVSKKSCNESCLLGKISHEDDKKLSETTEDIFMFEKESKTVNAFQSVRPSTSKIIYESDEETDVHNIQQNESDSDNTPSQIDQVEIKGDNAEIKFMEENMITSTNTNQEIGNVNKEGIINEKQKEATHKKSEITKKSSQRGLSSSTLDILNQLV